MISVNDILTIHKKLVDNFGGLHGVRDMPALESAIARPFQKYDNQLLYASVLEQGAALIESLLTNHPFADGNKRTGYVSLRLFLMQHGLDFNASMDERYDFVIQIASGSIKSEEILGWLEKHTTGNRSL